MKISRMLAPVLLAWGLASCESVLLPEHPSRGGGKASGTLCIRFAPESVVKSASSLPDTGSFLLTVADSKGKVYYEGSYAQSPEALSVPSGTYTVSAVSAPFEKPAFEQPQWGDTQCVVVSPGSVLDVALRCVQLNAGVRLNIDGSFLTACPDGALLLRSDDGSLLYAYGERRTAYFRPGPVSVVLSRGAKDEVLLTRTLQARDVLTLGVSAVTGTASAGRAGQVRIGVDTVRNHFSEHLVIGAPDSGRGRTWQDACTVAEARARIGEKDLWVCGYVVGGDLSSGKTLKTEGPFLSETNICLGGRAGVTDKAACLSVALPSGDIRSSLNLPGNPSLLGTRIYVKGDVVASYYGIPGLKNLTDFHIR